MPRLSKICPLMSAMPLDPFAYVNSSTSAGKKDSFVDCQKEDCMWYRYNPGPYDERKADPGSCAVEILSRSQPIS